MSLTAAQIQTARANNPIYKTKLGAAWLGYKASDAAADSIEFALAAHDFQLSLKLTADGMWGPNTNDAAGKLTLTPNEVSYAIQRNPYWQGNLGSKWAGDTISLEPVNSPLFAEAVYSFQLAHSLGTDGICGPETNAVALDEEYHPPVGTEYILVGGKQLPCNFKVVSPDEPGAMVFTSGFYPTPLLKPTLFALHWDVCRSSRSCFDVLSARNLSVQFLGDADGTIYQSIDPANGTCWHAGAVNRRAWGIEICDPVYLRDQDTSHPRPISTLRVRNDNSKILGFYPEQIDAVVKLCHWVCEYAGIPKQLPAKRGKPGVVWNSYFAPQPPDYKWDVHGFTGVCAHFHQDDQKIDPGMELWPALTASGFTIVEV
jgi:hypothetical protein